MKHNTSTNINSFSIELQVFIAIFVNLELKLLVDGVTYGQILCRPHFQNCRNRNIPGAYIKYKRSLNDQIKIQTKNLKLTYIQVIQMSIKKSSPLLYS